MRQRVAVGLLSGVAAVVATACGPADSRAADSQAAVGGSATAGVAWARFTKADFANLRFVEGQWRGTMASGKSFFEAFRMVNDSTMQEASFADSTFRTKIDSATIQLHDGFIDDRSNGPPWRATHLDGQLVNFANVSAPANHFAWRKDTAGTWQALIFTPDKLGHEQRVVNTMARAKR